MADINDGFDPNAVPPAEPFEVFPVGWYSAIITESDVKGTKDGKGKYIKLRWDVCDGEYQGRIVWQQITLKNANAKAEEIGARERSALCFATGVSAGDTAEWHNIPCKILVKIEPAKGDYPVKNVIKGIKPINEKAAQTVQPAPQQQPKPAATAKPAPTANGKPAWMNKRANAA